MGYCGPTTSMGYGLLQTYYGLWVTIADLWVMGCNFLQTNSVDKVFYGVFRVMPVGFQGWVKRGSTVLVFLKLIRARFWQPQTRLDRVVHDKICKVQIYR